MRSKKKILLCAAVALCMVLALAACGTSGGPSGGTSGQPAQASAPAQAPAASDSAAEAPAHSHAWRYYNCADLGLALMLPDDVDVNDIDPSDRNTCFLAESDEVFVDISRWDQVSDPSIEALAALAAESTMEDSEIVEQNGLKMAKVAWDDGDICYFVLAPDGDAYYVFIIGYADVDSELDPGAVAEDIRVISESICGTDKIPQGEDAVQIAPRQRPDIDYTVLVNKLNPLPETWEDDVDLVFMQNSVEDLVDVERTAYKAYLQLKADLAAEGVYIDLDSAYRSIEAQQEIADRFTEKYGEDYVAKYVAVPGYSEHHTGLALDLYLNVDGEDVYYNEDLVKYPEIWARVHEKLADHGFILRYIEGKEHITGYSYEPWHIRYVGVDNAKKIAASGMTLEGWLGAAKETDVALDYGSSTIYTEADMDDAIVQIKCKFGGWAGIELLNVRYAGDDCVSLQNLDWINALDEDAGYTKVIEFYTDFYTGDDVEGAWEPGSKYTNYEWWLGRTADSGWEIVSWGY